MPTPSQDETREQFISRCIPIVIQEGTADNIEQAVAVCGTMYDQAQAEAQTQPIDYNAIIQNFRW